MFGERLRESRRAQHLSLNDEATQADISVATLSRIENSKQGIELGLFLILAKILHQSPTDLLETLDESQDAPGVDPLVHRLSTLDPKRRTQLWNDMADHARERKRFKRSEMRQIASEVDELLAQIEYMRAEMESVRQRLRGRSTEPGRRTDQSG
jgi:transcriptional regulator with XRE-family HTH domain